MRLRIGSLLILALVALCGAGQTKDGSGSISIKLKAGALVNGKVVCLKDIASVEGDEARVSQLLETPLIDAPAPAESVKMTEQQLEAILFRKGIDASSFAISGASEIQITANFKEIKHDDFIAMVKDYLLKTIRVDPNERLTLDPISLPGEGDLVLPHGNISVEVTGEVNPKSKQIMVPVRIKVDGVYYKHCSVAFKVHRLADVAVAKRKMERHKVLENEDITIEERDLNAMSGEAITDIGSIVGKRTTRAVAPKQPVVASMVEMPPLIKRGDAVTVVARYKNLRITTLAEAKDDGRLGETIRLENVDSKKEVKAIVTGDKQAEIEVKL